MCPLCYSYEIKNFKASDQYFQCQHCYFIYMKHEFLLTPEQEKSRYDKHQNDVQNIGYQKSVTPLFELILSSINPPAKGLDYGCGPGPVVPYLLSKFNYQLELYDPFYKPHRDVLKQTYDFIFACEVVEHFYYPLAEFKSLVRILKPQGSLFIQTQFYHSNLNFLSWSYKNDPTHVGFYSLSCWEWLAKFFSLQIKFMDCKSGLVEFRKC